MLRKIIALSGRKESGKSELSIICKEFGFEICNFAGAMKEMLSEYLHISVDELNKQKEMSHFFYIDAQYLSDKLHVDKDLILKELNNIQFTSIRHALQFLGTQIIRKLCPNWHIDQLNKKIVNNPTQNFIIDDLRFKNELEFVYSVGGEAWYIIRPTNFNISNHKSEIDLTWKDFDDNIIINNVSLKRLRKKWKQYLNEIIHYPNFRIKSLFSNNNIKNKMGLRKWLLKELKTKTTSEIALQLNCSRDKILWWCDRLLISITKEKYKYNKEAFLYPTLEASYCGGLLTSDGCIKFSSNRNTSLISFDNMDYELVYELKKFLKSDRPISERIHKISHKKIYGFDCNNPYVLQNLKWWNIKPKKSQYEEIPDIICDNIDCLKQWVVGLIDGDGSIFITKRGSLGLTILASKEIIDFLEKFIPIKGSKREDVKKTKLCELHWNNHSVVDVRNWLCPKIYLPRKWDKINEFLEFKTKRRSIPFTDSKLT